MSRTCQNSTGRRLGDALTACSTGERQRSPLLVDGALRRRVVVVTVLVLVRGDHLVGFDQTDDANRRAPSRDRDVARKFLWAFRLVAFVPHRQRVSSRWNVRQ